MNDIETFLTKYIFFFLHKLVFGLDTRFLFLTSIFRTVFVVMVTIINENIFMIHRFFLVEYNII